MTAPDKELFEFDAFRLDPAEHLLLRDGEPVPLEPKVFETLLVLIRHEGRLVGKDELMRAVWPDSFVEESNLTRNISVLRKALNRNDGGRQYVETVPKRGYRFIGEARGLAGEQAELIVQSARVSVVVEEEESDEETKGQGEQATRREGEITTEHGAAVHATSGAEYVVTQLKTHQRSALITLAILVLAAVAAFFYFHRQPILTEQDTLLLADFVNTTGDTVFDVALKQALAVQLEQSPFLNIFSDQQIRETLRYMNRSPDEHITKDVAQEICERQGIKAMLTGSIAPVGSHYVIGLEAVNAQTGSVIARQQVEAESKEQVLRMLGIGATKLREKLGESLASIRKYDALVEATTPSLEALKAYSLGTEQHFKGKEAEALPFYKRAVELDPNFARAYDGMMHAYRILSQPELAIAAGQKAFELRNRGSEYEKLKIASDYYLYVTGEIEKAIEVLELLTQTYPRDPVAHNNLAVNYYTIGQYEKAIGELREAIRLNPNTAYRYQGLAATLKNLNRYEEAKQVCEQALAQKLDTTSCHRIIYQIAFVQRDAAGMQQQLDWLRGKPDEYQGLLWQAFTAAFHGQLRRASELENRAVDAQVSHDLKESALDTTSLSAYRAAYFGNCRQAREGTVRGATLPGTKALLFRTGITLALCGDLSQAQSVADKFAKQFPKDSLINAVSLPVIRAAIEIRRNNPAQAVKLLQSATRYDKVASDYLVFQPEYFRGQAYLAQGAGAEATTEFQKIVDRRGLAPDSFLYPLAYLGLARAAALTGDAAKSRKAYEDFLALWKDAEPDIPILIEAKKEYDRLK